MADNRRREKAKPKIHAETWYIVNDLIVQDWSPEQISGWLAVEKNVRISHERIYQHIARDKKLGGSLLKVMRLPCPASFSAGKKRRQPRLQFLAALRLNAKFSANDGLHSWLPIARLVEDRAIGSQLPK